MSPRERLHKLVEEIAEDDVLAAEKFLAFLRSQHDPVRAAIDAAPIDDEPEDDEERQAVAKAEAQFARGEGIPHDEALRHLGLERAS
ncbi:MAG: hypothetical protein HY675_19135 [Chloroflexi bacterium]|nr:hypothetical protein [Chloroflexota bacterium]